jgi:flavin-dependent dehydrogenase
VARLRALGVASEIEAHGLRVDGMILTGERGARVDAPYPAGQCGRAIVRRELDWLLLQAAIGAGCQFDPGVSVRGAVGDPVAGIAGVRARGRAGDVAIAAPVIIAADGRRSTVAFGLGLARHPVSPRRWAIGAYFENFGDIDPTSLRCTAGAPRAPMGRAPEGDRDAIRSPSVRGEMHIRRGRYIGVAPLPGGVTNVCLVRPARSGDPDFADAAALLTRELARDRLLADRAAHARMLTPPTVLGPLAVDVRPAAIDGLILAGDAAGFIDPMTGDGLRFAIRGGELAAAAALDALANGWSGIHARLAARRAREFGGKCRFNRALRAIVASPTVVDAAALGARVVPGVLRAVVARAGDCARAC